MVESFMDREQIGVATAPENWNRWTIWIREEYLIQDKREKERWARSHEETKRRRPQMGNWYLGTTAWMRAWWNRKGIKGDQSVPIFSRTELGKNWSLPPASLPSSPSIRKISATAYAHTWGGAPQFWGAGAATPLPPQGRPCHEVKVRLSTRKNRTWETDRPTLYLRPQCLPHTTPSRNKILVCSNKCPFFATNHWGNGNFWNMQIIKSNTCNLTKTL